MQREPGERVLDVRVEARRDEQQLGLERGDRALGPLERREVRVVAGARRERDVEQRLALLVRARPCRDRTATGAATRRGSSGRRRGCPACRSRGGRPSRGSRRARARARPAPSARRSRSSRRGRSPSPGPAARGGPGGRTSANPPRARRLDRRAGREQRRVVARLGADRVVVEPAARTCARARRAPACGSAARPPRSPARTRRRRTARGARRAAGPTRGGAPVGCSEESRGWLTTSMARVGAVRRDGDEAWRLRCRPRPGMPV